MTIIDQMRAMLAKSAEEGHQPQSWRIPFPTLLEIERAANEQGMEISTRMGGDARTILGLPFDVYEAAPGSMVQIQYTDRASEG